MSNRYNIFEEYGLKYYQLPKVFFTNEKYKKLSNDAKIAWSMLRDRFELSKKNKWFDENNEIYFIFTNEELMNLLQVKSKTTVSKIKKELIEADLLEQKRRGLNKANILYLLKPQVTKQDIYEIDKLESLPEEERISDPHKDKELGSPKNGLQENTPQTLEKQGSPKNGLQEVQKMDTNKTDFKETDFKEEEEEELVKFLVRKNHKKENAEKFFARLKEKAINGYTYDDILTAVERSLNDCQKGICDEPYIWAAGKLERLLEAKIKGKKSSIVSNSAKNPKSKKIIREEMMPDWFYELKEDERTEKEEDLKTIQKKLTEEQELEKKRRELEERLKNRRKQHEVL